MLVVEIVSMYADQELTIVNVGRLSAQNAFVRAN